MLLTEVTVTKFIHDRPRAMIVNISFRHRVTTSISNMFPREYKMYVVYYIYTENKPDKLMILRFFLKK